MHKKFIDGELTFFIDSSPKTQHTCCLGQWHEYNRHACQQGISFKEWWQAITQCNVSFNPEKEFVQHCRIDQHNYCNEPEEVTNINVTTIGCKPGKQICNNLCYKGQMSDFCYVEVPESKLLYYVFKFLQPAIYTPNVYEDNPNCFSQVDFRTLPLKSYHVINQKSVIRNYQENSVTVIL